MEHLEKTEVTNDLKITGRIKDIKRDRKTEKIIQYLYRPTHKDRQRYKERQKDRKDNTVSIQANTQRQATGLITNTRHCRK